MARPSPEPAVRLPLAFVLLGAFASVARAQDASPSGPRTAADRVRASIPAPIEPEGEGKPVPGFSWEADLALSGERAGTYRCSAEPGVYRGEPVWLTSEHVSVTWGGASTTTEVSLYLARDLSLLKGEWMRTSPEGSVRLDLRREGDRLKVVREVVAGTTEKEPETLDLPCPEGATWGRVALLLFLRHAPEAAATYELPPAPVEAAVPSVDGHDPAPAKEPIRVEVRGAAKYGTAPRVRDAWLAVVTEGHRKGETWLEAKGRAPLAAVAVQPPGLSLVPKGEGGSAVAYDDDKPATTWKAAFLKFGHGYHQAVEAWIIASIHWQSLYDADVASGSWPKEKPVEELRQAYVQEFLARSKHRPRADADALLRMTLATAEEKKLDDGTIVLATHPEFGGNVFHFRPIDGIWHIVKLEQ